MYYAGSASGLQVELARAPTSRVEAKLRRLLDYGGPPEGLAEGIAHDHGSAAEVEELLVRCINEVDRAAPPMPRPFSELEALTLTVRLLGAGASDISGDSVDPDVLRKDWVQQDGSVCRTLRSKPVLSAVLGSLRRHSEDFQNFREPFLKLEALRALRLQLESPLAQAGLRAPWWAEPLDNNGQDASGDALRSELLDVTMAAASYVADGQLSRRPQVAALSALYSVLSWCPTCQQLALTRGCPELVRDMLRNMLKAFGPPVEAAFVVCCDLLSQLAAGPAHNITQVAQFGVHKAALEVLQRFWGFRGVASSAFVLLGIVVNDQTVVQRIMEDGPNKLMVVIKATKRWPADIQRAVLAAPTMLSPAFLAALSTSPWTLALEHRRQTTLRQAIKDGRPLTQSTACPASLNSTLVSTQKQELSLPDAAAFSAEASGAAQGGAPLQEWSPVASIELMESVASQEADVDVDVARTVETLVDDRRERAEALADTAESETSADEAVASAQAAEMAQLREGIARLEEAVHRDVIEEKQREDAIEMALQIRGPAEAREIEEIHGDVVLEAGASSEHVDLVRRLWKDKQGTILTELCENLRQPDRSNPELADALTLQTLCRVCDKLRIKFGKDEEVQRQLLTVGCWVLYTMTDVDIDNLFGFKCPELPEGMESPKDRDSFWKAYREANVERRNPAMFQKANWAARLSYDTMLAADEDSFKQEAVNELNKWVKWICLLGATAQQLPEPITVCRGLCQLPYELVQKFRDKRPGDRIYWAAPSSTTDDQSIASNYCNQQLPVDKNVFFVIRGLTKALPLMDLSRYPGEREFLVPPFSELEVLEVRDSGPSQPLVVECGFGGCRMPGVFSQECLRELREVSESLEEVLQKKLAETAQLLETLQAKRAEAAQLHAAQAALLGQLRLKRAEAARLKQQAEMAPKCAPEVSGTETCSVGAASDLDAAASEEATRLTRQLCAAAASPGPLSCPNSTAETVQADTHFADRDAIEEVAVTSMMRLVGARLLAGSPDSGDSWNDDLRADCVEIDNHFADRDAHEEVAVTSVMRLMGARLLSGSPDSGDSWNDGLRSDCIEALCDCELEDEEAERVAAEALLRAMTDALPA